MILFCVRQARRFPRLRSSAFADDAAGVSPADPSVRACQVLLETLTSKIAFEDCERQ